MLDMTRSTPWTDLARVHRDLDSFFNRMFTDPIRPQSGEAFTPAATYGRFERAFTLPEEVDANHVQATYRHGMLELVLPLAEEVKPHRIAVKAAPEGKQLHAA